MRFPANTDFSRRYTSYGILGALGLWDHDMDQESAMVFVNAEGDRI